MRQNFVNTQFGTLAERQIHDLLSFHVKSFLPLFFCGRKHVLGFHMMAIFVTLNKGTAFVPNGKWYSSLIQRCSFVSVQNVRYFVWDCIEMSILCSYCTSFTFQINSCDCYAGRQQESPGVAMVCVHKNYPFAACLTIFSLPFQIWLLP